MIGANRHFSRLAADGPSFYVIGDIITVKLTAQETKGAYLIVEAVSPPGGGPAFLHTHPPQETFYVMEGVYEVYGQDPDGQKYAIRAVPGDAVHVPSNVPHGFKNVGDQTGRMILTYQPADLMLKFFQEIGIPMADRHSPPDLGDGLDMDRIMAILTKHLGLVEMPG
jgi:quercetin dioxygenase-like cupin family protein